MCTGQSESKRISNFQSQIPSTESQRRRIRNNLAESVIDAAQSGDEALPSSTTLYEMSDEQLYGYISTLSTAALAKNQSANARTALLEACDAARFMRDERHDRVLLE